MTLLTLALTAGALAQTAADFQTPTLALSPSQLSWGDGTTIGSPAPASHLISAIGAYPLLMLYETRISDPASSPAGCPAGMWGIGLAYRFGGNTSFTDAGAVLVPNADYYTCVAAHPAIVSLGTGDTWLVYFKAEQNPDTCNVGDGWGCDRYPGIGRFIIQYSGRNGNKLVYTVSTVDGDPVLTEVAQNMGYPSVMFANSEYHMMFGQFPDLYMTSSASTSSFSTPAFPEITSPSTATQWDEDELLSPNLLCGDEATGGNFKAYVSGRDYDATGTIIDQAFGLFDSPDLNTWTENPNAPFTQVSAGGPEMRHIAVLSSGDFTGWSLFYTSPNASGTNELWVSTSPNWIRTDIDERRCP